MKLTTTLFTALFLCSFSLFAQSNYGIKGSVIDSVSSSRLANTTVCVLNAKDSTLVKFTRVGATGGFAINNLKKGKFILMVTYPDYADYVEPFVLDSMKSEHDFGRLNMQLKSRLLHEIVVKSTRAAIKIKGDTTEFNASSFVVQPNAKVEDLLKQLPGIQVDKDGKITAQGQTVNKVLVDGEEFFGDDPTLVTKNLRADMVDKVQLYDKKSDQAAFTGVDDGVKNKTINIKLKEDKKNGYFGKLDGGLGTDGFYSSQALFNIFKGKKKLSVYGTMANTGKTGLGWEDNQKYASGDNVQFVDGGFYISGSGDELESFGGQYDGRGIPVARTGGVHYDNKWNNDKESINTNYKIGSLGVDGSNNTQTQNSFASGLIKSNADQDYHKYIFRQKLDVTYNVAIDSSSNLKISVDGTQKHNEVNNKYFTRSVNGGDSILNINARNLNNKGDEDKFNATFFYTKKFKKAGRTTSLNVTQSYDKNDTKGFLYSKADFYNTHPVIDSTQLVDQYKTNNTKTYQLSTNLTYSEPLAKSFTLTLNYGLGVNNSSASRKSFNQSAPGKYDALVAGLSNDFELNQLSNQGGADFNYKKGKTVVKIGSKVAAVNFNQVDVLNSNNSLKRDFVNWNPQANYQYKFSQQKSFSFYYSGNTTQPNIDQIQPVIVNTDPVNLTIGNQNLKPSFTNNFNAYYNAYKVLTDQWVYFSGGYSFTTNPIVSSVTTNSITGKTISQSVNLSDRTTSNFNLRTSVNRKIKKLNINAGITVSMNGNNYYNLAYDVAKPGAEPLNMTKSYTYSGAIILSKYAEKKYDLYINGGPTYTISQASLQPDRNNNGKGFRGYAGGTVYLPGKLEVGADADYQFNGKTQTFDQDFEQAIINARISKNLLKEDNLKITLAVNDLLNQNTGFSRNVSNSAITQTSYTTIKRYFLFSITYDFSHFGGGVKTE